MQVDTVLHLYLENESNRILLLLINSCVWLNQFMLRQKEITVMVCVRLALYLTLVTVDAVGISVRIKDR